MSVQARNNLSFSVAEMTRWNKRVDENHKQIAGAFRDFGCWVADLHGLGRGMPDLLVAIPPAHALALIEVKNAKKPPSQRKLTPAEQEFHDSCPALVWIVECLEDVQTVVQYYRHG